MTTAAFCASVHSTRTVPSRKVFQIVLEGPIEKYIDALQVIGNLNPAETTWLAIARLDPTKMEVQTSERTSPITTTIPTDPTQSLPGVDAPAGTRTLAQLAGAYGSLPAFQKFLQARGASDFVYGEQGAAVAIRNICNVISRRDIKVGTRAGDKFEQLVDDFHKWELRDRYVEAS